MFYRLRQHSSQVPYDLQTLPPVTPPSWLKPGQPVGFGGDLVAPNAGLAPQGMAKQMAYQSVGTATAQLAHVGQQLFRVARGVAKQRYGARQIVYQTPVTTVSIPALNTPVATTQTVIGSSNIAPAYPQFRPLYVYTQAPGQVQTGFRVGLPSDRVRWPIPTSGTISTGA